MDTDEIMNLALNLAGMRSVPADSGIHVPSKNISKVLLCVDAGPAELMLAKNLDCDGVVAHHPIGKAALNFPPSFLSRCVQSLALARYVLAACIGRG